MSPRSNNLPHTHLVQIIITNNIGLTANRPTFYVCYFQFWLYFSCLSRFNWLKFALFFLFFFFQYCFTLFYLIHVYDNKQGNKCVALTIYEKIIQMPGHRTCVRRYIISILHIHWVSAIKMFVGHMRSIQVVGQFVVLNWFQILLF